MNEITQALPKHLMEATGEVARAPKNTLGKDDFMKLLMAQLQNQDPLKPMDHEQFSAQLAQFGSLEQLQNIGKGIDRLHNGFGDEQKLQALSMIGKKVDAMGNEISLQEGGTAALRHGLPDQYKPTKAAIYDANGMQVREITIAGNNGSNEIVWDGKNQDGGKAPTGKYTFRVSGVGPTGDTQEAGAQLSGTVTGVEIDGKNAVLVVQSKAGSSRISLDKVKAVSQDTSESRPMMPLHNSPAPVQNRQTIAVPQNLIAEAKEAAEVEPESDEMDRQSHAFMPGEVFRP